MFYITISFIFLDLDFSQQSFSSDFEMEGMKKHALDKPFDPNQNINYSAKRGSRRSKKKRNN